MEIVKAWDTDNTELTQSLDPEVRFCLSRFFDPEEGRTYLVPQPVINGTPSQAFQKLVLRLGWAIVILSGTPRSPP
jgi:hypothetical protein